MTRREGWRLLLLPGMRMINGRLGEPRVDDEAWLARQLDMLPAKVPWMAYARLIQARWANTRGVL